MSGVARGSLASRPLGRLVSAALAAGVLAVSAAVLSPAPAAAFSGFGALHASEQYGQQMVFSVDLAGSAPDELQVLLQFGPDPDSTFVAPATLSGSTGTYTWDAATDYVTPNTAIRYRFRATAGGTVTVSPAATLLYADNRSGLDWQSATIGQAVVHWYGSEEAQARHFGDLTSGAVSRAEATLGHALAGPIDIFVYDTQSQFFGALGPGAREWTGAATFPDIRTVFMWLQGFPTQTELDRTLVHEVTHVVFYDATRNPYHEPAHWLNEGFSVWSEQQNATSSAGTVRSEVSSGLISFDALTGQFPIGSRAASLSYAEGATMVAYILDHYGSDAMARVTAAYRAGSTDAAALQAGTGIPADQLYADYYRSFGAEPPQPVAAATIGPSVVRTGAGSSQAAAPAAGASPSPPPGVSEAASFANGVLAWVTALALVVVIVLGVLLYRRRARSPRG